VAAGVLLGLGGVRVVEPRMPTAPIVRGLRVDGVAVGHNGLRRWLDERASAAATRAIVLSHGENRFEATLADIGVSLNIDDTYLRATAVGHRGSILRRLRETSDARAGQVDIELSWHFDEEAARAKVASYADDLATEPKDAWIDLEGHRKVPDESGQRLDVDATVAQLRAIAHQERELNLVTRALPADVTLHDLDAVDVSKVLSTFETRYAVFKRGRSKNVEHAARLLNGMMLRPGAIISFNKRVGPRTRERGFELAAEIVGDELTTGIGGGTCQVSSTLHGAALYGGLDIVARKSHTRPSDYTRLGLDATVAYPTIDLKVRNPYRFPIVIHSFIPKPGLMKVELLGGKAVDEVKYRYGVARVEEFVRRIKVKPNFEPGRVKRKQRGTRGMEVFSWVTVRYLDGRVQKRQYYSGYKATPEIYWVAPDFNRSDLPELPKWAKGVEGELADGSDVYPTL
jgi:vancomycin resistance protein YoaR